MNQNRPPASTANPLGLALFGGPRDSKPGPHLPNFAPGSSLVQQGRNQALTLNSKPVGLHYSLAESTGLPLQTERQCPRIDAGLRPHLGSRPAGDTATVGLRW